MAGPKYLDGLNPEQRAAVETIDGPVLVLAGAGTGKTRVLTTRLAHILATGRARGHEILAVTFTNKAAREMKERIGRLIGEGVEGMPWLGTFHSIGVKLLRRHAELVDLKSGFTILDTDDQIRLLKQLLEAEKLDAKRWPARQLAGLIDDWKNRGLLPADVPKGEGAVFGGGKGLSLYGQYQKRLKELNAVDFGDLLLECLRLFRQHPDVLATYNAKFKYLLVDEYQDTNVAQYLWLRLLAQAGPRAEPVAALPVDPDAFPGDMPMPLARAPRNICCVGDDDQSIYGWRGAEVDNILRFEKDFPGAAVIRLETNYRSTAHILDAASGLIAHNKGRLGKTLRTDGDSGEKVVVSGVWDDAEEARSVGETIEQLQRKGRNLNDVAILVRASYQMRAFEDRFVTLGMPYRVIGGPRFYERQEIKDAIAYLELVVNPTNDLKFERIVNTPKRGIGDKTVGDIHAHARARETWMMQAAREMTETDDLKAAARRAITDLIGQFDRWRALAPTMPHTELAQVVLDESGYTAMWQQDKNPQSHARLENLKELIRFMGDFETLQAFLEHVTLVMDAEQGEDGQRVSLMTLHGAKGLEFETVFLPGWEEGLFPSQRTMDESGLAGLEEERRLAYVGVTRARKQAFISFAQNRRIHALYQSQIPSRFVDELPERAVEVAAASTGNGGFGGIGGYVKSRFDEPAAGFKSPYATPGWQRAQKSGSFGGGSFNPDAPPRATGPIGSGSGAGAAAGRMNRPNWRSGPTTIEGELVASSAAADAGFAIGDRVFHDKFGYGKVVTIEGNKLTVDFEKSDQKRVVASFVTRT